MDLIFTGIPKKREIVIYLLSNKYSLLRNLKFKRDILKRKKLNNLFRKPKLFIFKNNFTKKIEKLKERIKENDKEILNYLRYAQFSHFLLNNSKVQEFEINEIAEIGSQNKLLFFENLSDDENKNDEFFNDNKIKMFKKTKRHDNLKSICNQHNSKISNQITERKNTIDLGKITSKKIDFNFVKPFNKKNKCFVLKDIINVKKKKRNSQNDYIKILKRNTIINTGYENVKIFPTCEKSEMKIVKKCRKAKIKWDQNSNDDIHNLNSPISILKKTKLNDTKSTQNKHKEIVFLQNIDTYEE